MYFKLTHLLKKLGIIFSSDETVSFKFNDEKSAIVTLRELSKEEKERYKNSVVIHCEAIASIDVPTDIKNMLDRLAVGLMPEDFVLPSKFTNDKEFNVSKDGAIKPGTNPPVSLYSKTFQNFEGEINSILSEYIRKVAKVIRWKLGLPGSHKSVGITLGMNWSLDGIEWFGMPHAFTLKLGMEFPKPIRGQLYNEIELLLRKGESEPLGHELFLEAWEQKYNNPRSALILGITAAEVGIKQCVAKLVPDAQWLVDNLPSPPITKLLFTYLPELPAKLKIDDRVLPPPKKIRKIIAEGVELRNKAIHLGHEELNKDELEELLLSVRDLLYLLDFYCGFTWTTQNIRPETRIAMKQEYNVP